MTRDVSRKDCQMKITVYTYFDYVCLDSISYRSPTLFDCLIKRGIEIVYRGWGGSIVSLPVFGPAIIRASDGMKCKRSELEVRCAELNHLCFFEEELLFPDNRRSTGVDLKAEVSKFLDLAFPHRH